MVLTPGRRLSQTGLSGTIAWSRGDQVSFAFQGTITVSAQAAAFAALLLGLSDAAALSDLAQTVAQSGGVTFVPAMAGLGVPHWNDAARGTIGGMTLATKPAHIARATFEAVALQIADVFAAMERDIGQPLAGLLADGGASANRFLMQLQADLLNRPVTRSDLTEVGAMGAAAIAFHGLGIEARGLETTASTVCSTRRWQRTKIAPYRSPGSMPSDRHCKYKKAKRGFGIDRTVRTE